MHSNRSSGARKTLLRFVFNNNVVLVALAARATMADVAFALERLAPADYGDPLAIELIAQKSSSQYEALFNQMARVSRSCSFQTH